MSSTETAAETASDRGAAAIEAEKSAERAKFQGPARWTIILGTLAAIALAVNQLFNLRLGGYAMLEGMYLYLLAGIFLSLTFLCFRLDGSKSTKVPWYDWVLAGITATIAGFFTWTASESLDNGWEYAAPDHAIYASIALYALILEGTRRAGGLVLFAIVLVFSLYPTFASHVPDPLSGFQQPFTDVIPFFMISSEASFGIPMRAFGNLVIGFILFGAILQFTGGGAVLQRSRPVAGGSLPRRGGQGRHLCLRVHGVHVRVGHLERADHRRRVHPRHEEDRVRVRAMRRRPRPVPRPEAS